VAKNPANIQAIAWGISGTVGVVCVVLWITLDIPQKITDLVYGRQPALGSLSYVNLIAEIGKHQQSGRIDARVSVEVTNTNDFLVKFHASVSCEVNGTPSGVLNLKG